MSNEKLTTEKTNQDLILQRVFEIIRKEDAILWVGAGLSLSSGYPSGKKLAEKIFNDLPNQQKKHVNKNLPLPLLADEYVKVTKKRENLISILDKEFTKKKNQNPRHFDQLGKIFHFDSIITTNYDTLIEDAYDFRCQIIRPKDPISILNPKKVHIFKVHGDLEDKENIIITSSDYNSFFQERKENDGLWTFIKSKIYTKSIIFIGYNLEDPNTSVLFDRIMCELDIEARESFLIAPNFPKHQIQNLKDRRVTYLDLYGEEFIDLLVENIDHNLVKDTETGICNLDTFFKTTQAKSITFNLEPQKNKTKIKSLSGLNEEIKTNLNLVFPKKSIVAEKINDLMSGKNLNLIELDAQLFEKMELKVGDLHWGNQEDFKTLIIKRLPNHETYADFVFEDEKEFNNIPLRIYKSKGLARFELGFPSATFTITFPLDPNNISFNEFHYSHKAFCDIIIGEIQLFELLMKISKGEKFSLLFDDQKFIDLALEKLDLLYTKELLAHFRDLRKIEKFYGKKFIKIPIESITHKTKRKADKIISYINQKPLTIEKWEGNFTANIKSPDDTADEIISKIGSNGGLLIKENSRTNITLYNQEFDVGYKYTIIQEPKALVLKEHKNTWNLRINSAINTLIIGFSNEQKI